MDELRQEVIAFGEENAKLRLNLDVAINNAADLQEKMYEQQAAIQQMRRKSLQSRFAFCLSFLIQGYEMCLFQ